MLRIITGRLKGRQLKTPEGIRPTEDRIRKALFDIIDPEGMSFLELFAGSGAVGFEALSRGAAGVVFVEKERACVRVIEENARNLGVLGEGKEGGRVEVLAGEAGDSVCFLFKKQRKFDLIYLDPPYYKGISEKILQTLGGYDILRSSGIIIVQHHRKDPLADQAGELIVFRQARYGDSLLSFYQKSHQNVRESNLSGDV